MFVDPTARPELKPLLLTLAIAGAVEAHVESAVIF
jgi:hypothetical protein